METTAPGKNTVSFHSELRKSSQGCSPAFPKSNWTKNPFELVHRRIGEASPIGIPCKKGIVKRPDCLGSRPLKKYLGYDLVVCASVLLSPRKMPPQYTAPDGDRLSKA